MCLAPITLVAKKQHIITGSITNVVPCGSCPKCLTRKLNSWAFRLITELDRSTSAIMLTLTYTDEKLPAKHYQDTRIWRGSDVLFKLAETESLSGIVPILVKTDLQLFYKRLRKAIPNKLLKYYAVGEYGSETQRPHYHSIIYNLPETWTTNPNQIMDIWGNGNVHIAPVNMATIKYTLKYLMKGGFDTDTRTKPFSLMSKKMGLNYLTPAMIKHHKDHLKSYVTLPQGQKSSLPRYFSDKLFTDEEKYKINKQSQESREDQSEKFNNSNHESQWKQDQYRKAAKIKRLQQSKL